MEICADCGDLITPSTGSYYRKDPASDIGKTYHSTCGDPFGVHAAVDAAIAAERERCALIAVGFGEFPSEPGASVLIKELRVMCGNVIAEKIRDGRAITRADGGAHD
jgi:hypothetical protein